MKSVNIIAIEGKTARKTLSAAVLELATLRFALLQRATLLSCAVFRLIQRHGMVAVW